VRDVRAYFLDLWQKVVVAVERGDSTIEEADATFGVGPHLREEDATSTEGDRRPQPAPARRRARDAPLSQAPQAAALGSRAPPRQH
jgi:hypothetical protein